MVNYNAIVNRHRRTIYRHDVENKLLVRAGRRQRTGHAVAVQHQFLFDLNGAVSRFYLDQQHNAAERIVAVTHALSDAFDKRDIQAIEFCQTKGEAVLEFGVSGRCRLVSVWRRDIVIMPSLDRNIAFTSVFCVPAAKRQIGISRGYNFKVIGICTVCHFRFAAVHIEPSLAASSWGDLFRKVSNSTVNAVGIVAAADDHLIDNTRDSRFYPQGILTDTVDGEAHIGDVRVDRGVTRSRMQLQNHRVFARSVGSDKTGGVKGQNAPVGRLTTAAAREIRPGIVRLGIVCIDYDIRMGDSVGSVQRQLKHTVSRFVCSVEIQKTKGEKCLRQRAVPFDHGAGATLEISRLRYQIVSILVLADRAALKRIQRDGNTLITGVMISIR